MALRLRSCVSLSPLSAQSRRVLCSGPALWSARRLRSTNVVSRQQISVSSFSRGSNVPAVRFSSLSKAKLDQLNRDGYTVIPNFATATQVEQLKQTALNMIDQFKQSSEINKPSIFSTVEQARLSLPWNASLADV